MYESYVTINPVFTEDLDKLKEITERHKFEWFESELSEGNMYALSFMQGHDSKGVLETITRVFITELKMKKFNIWEEEIKRV